MNNYMNRFVTILFKLIFLSMFMSSTMNFAQDLSLVNRGLSTMKKSFLITKDSIVIKGYIKLLHKKNGFIDYIKVKDDYNKIHIYYPKDLKGFYAYPNQVEKISRVFDFMKTSKNWATPHYKEENSYSKDVLVDKGYISYESTIIKHNNKKEPIFAQLLNESFSEFVKVYYNPKSTKVLQSTSSNQNSILYDSYFLKIDTLISVKISKNIYPKIAKTLWSNCIFNTSDKPFEFQYFVRDILLYNTCKFDQ